MQEDAGEPDMAKITDLSANEAVVLRSALRDFIARERNGRIIDAIAAQSTSRKGPLERTAERLLANLIP